MLNKGKILLHNNKLIVFIYKINSYKSMRENKPPACKADDPNNMSQNDKEGNGTGLSSWYETNSSQAKMGLIYGPSSNGAPSSNGPKVGIELVNQDMECGQSSGK